MPKIPTELWGTGAYAIRNRIDGKVYVGGAYKSFVIEKDLASKDGHRNEHLQSAWNLSGKRNPKPPKNSGQKGEPKVPKIQEVLRDRSLSNGGKRATPLWEGPCSNGPNGGVTQGLLQKFLTCRERARLLLVEGWKATEKWSKPMGYGEMWHLCEEQFAALPKPGAVLPDGFFKPLVEHAREQCRRFPFQQEEIDHWHNVCKTQFPLYVSHWAGHPHRLKRTPLLEEFAFSVAYSLPSGRVVRLRGKWDSVDRIDGLHGPEVWLMESKSKGEINEAQLRRQLTFDLQTMLYLIALDDAMNKHQDCHPALARFAGPLKGVRYNVIRRPLSGGKGTIKRGEGTKGAKCPRCKQEKVKMAGCPKCRGSGRVGAKPPEAKEAFYGRLAKYIKDAPQEYFMRWEVEITKADLERFKRETLDPVLEQLCDWWQQLTDKGSPVAGNYRTPLSYRMPYGVYSPLLDGGETDLDVHLENGSTVGLRRADVLFSELEG